MTIMAARRAKMASQDGEAIPLADVSPIPTSITNSPGIDARGQIWIDFFPAVADNDGGTPVTQVDGYVECRDTAGGDWRRVTIEEVDGSTGDAPQLDWHWIRTISGTDVALPAVTVPVVGVEMRLAYKGNATPAAGSHILISALRR